MSRTMRLTGLAFPLLATLAACNILQPSVKNTTESSKRIHYALGPCFGRCPVYTLDVYENGLLVYRGERFTEKPGTWQRSLDRSRVMGLIDSFERVSFAEYPAAFRSQIPDYAATTITHVDARRQTSTTSYREYAPEELLALGESLKRLANLPGYRQVTDTLSRNPFRGVDVKAREELIVELNPGTNAGAWVIKYGKQGVELKERLSPTGDYYLLLANPNIMGADELLNYLRQDEEVVGAQRNARVAPR